MSTMMMRVDGSRRATIKDDVHRRWYACYRAVRFQRRYFGNPDDPLPDLEVIVRMVFFTRRGPDRAVSSLVLSQNLDDAEV